MATYIDLEIWKRKANTRIVEWMGEIDDLVNSGQDFAHISKKISDISIAIKAVTDPSLTAAEREDIMSFIIDIGCLNDAKEASLVYLQQTYNPSDTSFLQHNNLRGLQGGSAANNQYVHLTQAEKDALTVLIQGGSGGGNIIFTTTDVFTNVPGEAPVFMPAGTTDHAALRKYLIRDVATIASLTGGATVERGGATSRTLTFNVTKGTYDIATIVLTGGTGVGLPITATGVTQTGTRVVTNTANTDTTFTLTVTDTNGGVVVATTNVVYQFRYFVGNNALTTLLEADIEALALNDLSITSVRTYSIGAGAGYKYFCFPESYTQPTLFKDAITGFAIGMEAPITTAITNANGVALNMKVYRTTNPFSEALVAQIL